MVEGRREQAGCEHTLGLGIDAQEADRQQDRRTGSFEHDVANLLRIRIDDQVADGAEWFILAVQLPSADIGLAACNAISAQLPQRAQPV